MKYGNTYATGVATFKNRSIVVEGEVKSVSRTDCRFAFGTSYAGSSWIGSAQSDPPTCDRSEKFSFVVPANIRGGPTSMRIGLHSQGDSWKTLDTAMVYR